MNDLIYDALANSSCLWIRCDCGLPSFATSLFDYSSCMETSNRFSPLAHTHSQAQNMDDSVSYQTPRGLPNSTSTPKTTPSLPSAQSAQKSRRLRLHNVNFRSVVNKIDQFHAMVDSVKPDIIVGTESWLRPDIMNSEIFPSNYTVYRHDRDTSGGGVFIAVTDEILSTRQQHLETSCEMAWAKISIVGYKDLYVCSYYRPKADDRDSLDLLFSSLDRICNSKNCHIWLAGDFNFPGIDWASKTLKHNCPSSDLHELFVKSLDDYGLTQMVDKPTRLSNTLDLFTTNNPTLISEIKVIPRLADHDAVTIIIEGDISPIVNKQKPRKIHLYKKADWEGFKEFMQGFSDEICDRTPLSGEENENDAESLWQAFKSQLHLGINKFIPSKIAKKKNLYPWIDADLRRLIRKRNRYFKIKNRTNNPRDINHYKSLKREVQRRVRKSYWSHVEEILEPRDAENNPPTSKCFWSFIKHARSDKSGISSLMAGCDIVTDSTTKAKLLNDKFQRAFSKSVPMKLKHIA